MRLLKKTSGVLINYVYNNMELDKITLNQTTYLIDFLQDIKWLKEVLDLDDYDYLWEKLSEITYAQYKYILSRGLKTTQKEKLIDILTNLGIKKI